MVFTCRKLCAHGGDAIRAFEQINEVLPPFTDVLSKYMGMVAIVTLVGQSPQTGQVVVRR